MSCDHCGLPFAELGFNIASDHTNAKSGLVLHQKHCPTAEEFTAMVGQIRQYHADHPDLADKIGHRRQKGGYPSTGIDQRYSKKMYKWVLKSTGLTHHPVMGDRRAALEELGYTPEKDFFPARAQA